MNIFVFRNCYTGGVSGGDTHMDGILLWLKKHRPDTKPFLIFAKNDGQEQYYPGAKAVEVINYGSPNGLPFSILFVIRALLAVIKVRLPWASSGNTLIASSHFLPDVLPVFFKKTPGVERVVYIHHIIQEMPRPKNLNTILANVQEQICFFLIKRKFNKVIVVNEETKQSLIKRGFSRQRILVSSNFIDTSMNKKLLDLNKRKVTLVYCGRMVPQKGIDDFIDVCSILNQDFVDFSAVMMGTGPELERINIRIEEENLPIKTTGFAEESEKYRWLSNSKIFVFPSREEGWGITIAESLAAGTPVVTYDLPVYQSVFQDNLHTVPVADKQKLFKTVSQLLKMYKKQPEVYTEEQLRITNFSKNFSIDSVAKLEVNFLLED